MTSSVSNVTICNRALQMLGQSDYISSLTATSGVAIHLNVAYDPQRRALLRRYPWTFAIKRASVAADSAVTLYNNWNRYQLPNDYIRLIRPYGRLTDSRVDWRIEAGFIVTGDGSPLQFRYIYDVTDTSLFDPLFCEALSALIAQETVQQITGSDELNKTVQGKFALAIENAKKADSFERDAVMPLQDDFIDAMM